MRKEFVAALILSFMVPVLVALSAATASADWIGTSNQTGDLKNTFYTNETVYVVSANITSSAQDVRVYIVENNDSWVDGKALNDITEDGYLTITTNNSGYLPVTAIWGDPEPGSYDIVADMDRDGEYNSTYDFVNSSSTVGFTVIQAPIPTLNVEAGGNNPSSHDWDLENDTGHNSMLQIDLSASVEPIRINSIAITATGTGDDKEDITVAYLVLDQNGNGEYDQGEMMIGYSDYLRDDGVITFEISGGQLVPEDSSVTMLITYIMSTSGQTGSTYKFDIASISAVGTVTLQTASIVGIPIGSAIKTITGGAPTTTTTTTTGPNGTTTTTTITTTTTTTIPIDKCLTDDDCNGMTCNDKQKTTYSCEYDSNKGVNVCAGTIVSVGCCGDGDCEEGYHCSDYNCVKEDGGIAGWLSGGLGGREYTWTIISIVVMVGLAVVVFLIIKNRNKKPWKSRRDYEKEWDSLRKKWEKKK